MSVVFTELLICPLMWCWCR